MPVINKPGNKSSMVPDWLYEMLSVPGAATSIKPGPKVMRDALIGGMSEKEELKALAKKGLEKRDAGVSRGPRVVGQRGSQNRGGEEPIDQGLLEALIAYNKKNRY